MVDEEKDKKVEDILKTIMAYSRWEDRVGGLVRDLGDGREIHLVQEIDRFRISIGPSGSDGWDDAWWYRNQDVKVAVATATFREWDGEGDAPGPWVRTTYHAEPGVEFRRRSSGCL